jgi:hypothetical protein
VLQENQDAPTNVDEDAADAEAGSTPTSNARGMESSNHVVDE